MQPNLALRSNYCRQVFHSQLYLWLFLALQGGFAQQMLHNDFSNHPLKDFKANVERQAALFPESFFLQGLETEKVIALSFDDGPDRQYTPQILDVLAAYDIKASFFVIAWRLESFEDVTQRIIDEGHLLAGHTVNHPDLRDFSPEEAFEQEIWPTQALIERFTGKPAPFFRPPYGALTDEELHYLQEKGIVTVNWSVDSMDWSNYHDASSVRKNVLNFSHPGAIVLMHAIPRGGPKSLAVLTTIIETLQDQGYRFVTIDEMLAELLPKAVKAKPSPVKNPF